MILDWNLDKNEWLKEHRNISFDEISCLISEGFLKTVLNHKKKKNQKILVAERNGYAYNVPVVENMDGVLFMKTIYPSRVSTRKYSGGKE